MARFLQYYRRRDAHMGAGPMDGKLAVFYLIVAAFLTLSYSADISFLKPPIKALPVTRILSATE